MTQNIELPIIQTEFDISLENSNHMLYSELIKSTLRRILEENQFKNRVKGPAYYAEVAEFFKKKLPLILTKGASDAVPTTISFYTISKFRSGSFKFFFEMISRWLIPEKKLNVLLMYAVDFSMPEIGKEIYTLCEQVIRVDSQEEWDIIQQNIPIIESELALGFASSHHARRILELKGLNNNEKGVMIQERISNIMARLPKDFTYDVFTEMQHVLVTSRDEFKLSRDVHHLSRIISIQYLFRKGIRKAIKESPGKRHLYVKVFKGKIRVDTKEKSIIGLIVAVNFLREKEFFEEAHLLKAIKNYIPEAMGVKDSFYFSRRGSEPICTLYVEVEKQGGESFTADEVNLLREALPVDLEGRIEHLMHPVFMPRNEEEVMRNILTLGGQIRFLRDLPQIFITFDEQTDNDLYFTVILVRVIREEGRSIQVIFSESDTFLEYFHDRCKIIGHLRKKYPKEATVFRVKVSKEQFLRRDHSIDLYKARLTVVNEMSRIIGDIRDYNGGMISKQNELLMKVSEQLKGTPNYNEVLFENFFYSLNPVIMRTVLEPEALKKLFLMLLEAISEGFFNDESYAMKIRTEASFVYIMIGAESRDIEDAVLSVIQEMKISSTALVSSSVNVYNNPYMGYIFRCDDPLLQKEFCSNIQHAVEYFEQGRDAIP